MADFNLNGELTKILMYIKKQDLVGDVNERGVYITRNKRMLEGFSTSRKAPFDAIVKTPVIYSVIRDELRAVVEFPELQQGINYSPGEYSYYPVQYRTEWSKPGVGFLPVELKLCPSIIIDDSCTIVLSVGIEFGNAYLNGIIEEVKYMSGGKILGLF